MDERPVWLIGALGGYPRDASTWRDTQPTDVCVGDIVVAANVGRPEVPDRLVIVIRADTKRRQFTGILATNELPLATADDVILPPDSTGLRYIIVAMARLAGDLHCGQVKSRVGVLTERSLAAVHSGYACCEDTFHRTRRGLPLQDRRWDLRWAEIEGEANAMRSLCDTDEWDFAGSPRSSGSRRSHRPSGG